MFASGPLPVSGLRSILSCQCISSGLVMHNRVARAGVELGSHRLCCKLCVHYLALLWVLVVCPRAELRRRFPLCSVDQKRKSSYTGTRRARVRCTARPKSQGRVTQPPMAQAVEQLPMTTDRAEWDSHPLVPQLLAIGHTVEVRPKGSGASAQILGRWRRQKRSWRGGGSVRKNTRWLPTHSPWSTSSSWGLF